MAEFFCIGTLTATHDEACLRTDRAKRVFAACRESSAVSPVEIRQHKAANDSETDILIADFFSDEIPTKNQIGILYPERLAIAIPVNTKTAPTVHAVRKDFPPTLHQNVVAEGEPRSLCLYQLPWRELEITWTPKKFVRRIIWWLGEAAKGSIHQRDQPLEPPFLHAADDLIIPPILKKSDAISGPCFGAIHKRDNGSVSFRVYPLTDKMVPRARDEKLPLLHVAVLETVARVHELYDRTPRTLSALDDLLEVGEASVGNELKQLIRTVFSRYGEASANDQIALVVLFPRLRQVDSPPERTDYVSFLLVSTLAEVGETLGVIGRHGSNWGFLLQNDQESAHWRNIEVVRLNVVFDNTYESLAKLNGRTTPSLGKAVLCGAGMLGSQMLTNWVRGGWNDWSVIDDDHIQPHNLARHTAIDSDIGKPKAIVVADHTRSIFPPYLGAQIEGHVCDVIDAIGGGIAVDVIGNAALIVDATASLRVSRVLGRHPGKARVVSAFLTPNGNSFVLLAENTSRETRMDALECQYWRWVITHLWGQDHLKRPISTVRYGGGCGDVSGTMSNSAGTIAGAILSEQIVSLAYASKAMGAVWQISSETGSIRREDISVSSVLRVRSGVWEIVWDSVVDQTIAELRKQSLPSETGGILLGYVDHSTRTIYVVHVLQAPPDSRGGPGFFERGTEGLTVNLRTIWEQTAENVCYLGEWHSHPRGHGHTPSQQDTVLMNYLIAQRRPLGEPGIMAISADAGINWWIEE